MGIFDPIIDFFDPQPKHSPKASQADIDAGRVPGVHPKAKQEDIDSGKIILKGPSPGSQSPLHRLFNDFGTYAGDLGKGISNFTDNLLGPFTTPIIIGGVAILAILLLRK